MDIDKIIGNKDDKKKRELEIKNFLIRMRNLFGDEVADRIKAEMLNHL